MSVYRYTVYILYIYMYVYTHTHTHKQNINVNKSEPILFSNGLKGRQMFHNIKVSDLAV